MTPEARIAEALSRHHHSGVLALGDGRSVPYCQCGEQCPDGHTVHQAAVIASLPGIANTDTASEASEKARKDARRELGELRCINGLPKYNEFCNVTYDESDQYACEFGSAHYFDAPEAIAFLEARAGLVP